MPEVCRLHDSSSHGGTIISAYSKFLVDGVEVAVNGDMHSCPIQGHGVTAITSSSKFIIDGQPAVVNGDTCGCGAAMIASFQHFNIG